MEKPKLPLDLDLTLKGPNDRLGTVALQALLMDRSYLRSFEPGVFEKGTLEALMAYQRNIRCRYVTGRFGHSTWAKMPPEDRERFLQLLASARQAKPPAAPPSEVPPPTTAG